MAVPEGGAAKSKYKDLECQPPLIDPKETNGSLTEVSTQGDPPPNIRVPAPSAATEGSGPVVKEDRHLLSTARNPGSQAAPNAGAH